MCAQSKAARGQTGCIAAHAGAAQRRAPIFEGNGAGSLSAVLRRDLRRERDWLTQPRWVETGSQRRRGNGLIDCLAY
jgi:hypothetical protein